MLSTSSSSSTRIPSPLPHQFNVSAKKKRRPAGTPDPDAEVVALSPQKLLESDHYVCEICNLGFQRDQNLQMHRRRHKVPWKLLKREAGPDGASRRRVFVCPEPTCLHNDPRHALGDLVGIKKHYRRKHSKEKKWVCGKCSKGYAVQSDYKAHLKICGTRGHSCDCGKVFSRVESFIEHQDSCAMGLPFQTEPPPQQQQPQACLSWTASSPSPLGHTNRIIFPKRNNPSFPLNPINSNDGGGGGIRGKDCSLELRLVTAPEVSSTFKRDLIESTTHLRLSIGSSCDDHSIIISGSGYNGDSNAGYNTNKAGFLRTKRDDVREQMRLAMEEKAYAEEVRKDVRRELEFVEKELEEAKRMRQRARVELDGAVALKEHAAMEMELVILRITCRSNEESLGFNCVRVSSIYFIFPSNFYIFFYFV